MLQSNFEETEVFRRDCPTRAVLNRIADKWTLYVINLLAEGPPRRFGEMKRAIGGISQKMLTQTLRELERDGLVRRTVYPEVPPRVEYELTFLGRTLCAPLTALRSWAHRHIREIESAQTAFDARESAKERAS